MSAERKGWRSSFPPSLSPSRAVISPLPPTQTVKSTWGERRLWKAARAALISPSALEGFHGCESRQAASPPRSSEALCCRGNSERGKHGTHPLETPSGGSARHFYICSARDSNKHRGKKKPASLPRSEVEPSILGFRCFLSWEEGWGEHHSSFLSLPRCCWAAFGSRGLGATSTPEVITRACCV